MLKLCLTAKHVCGDRKGVKSRRFHINFSIYFLFYALGVFFRGDWDTSYGMLWGYKRELIKVRKETLKSF